MVHLCIVAPSVGSNTAPHHQIHAFFCSEAYYAHAGGDKEDFKMVSHLFWSVLPPNECIPYIVNYFRVLWVLELYKGLRI